MLSPSNNTVIETMHDINLSDRINLCLKYQALDYKWIIRNFLTNCSPKIRSTLKINDNRIDNTYKENEVKGYGIMCSDMSDEKKLYALANNTFDYYDKWKKTFDREPSLSAISEMCNDLEYAYDVLKQDDQLYFLSRVFNCLTDTTRGLYKCYDCGTNARAIFLRLVKKHRGNDKDIFFTLKEQARMRTEYTIYGDIHPEEIVMDAYKQLKNYTKPGVFIFSLGLDNFGHVWVIEKQFKHGVPRYHQYQSCFRSHMVMDFLAFKNYGEDPDQSLDIDEFFKNLYYLFVLKGPWSNKDYLIFSKLFAFLPVYPIMEGKPSISFTSIMY